jgi:hypothetical protein
MPICKKHGTFFANDSQCHVCTDDAPKDDSKPKLKSSLKSSNDSPFSLIKPNLKPSSSGLSLVPEPKKETLKKKEEEELSGPFNMLPSVQDKKPSVNQLQPKNLVKSSQESLDEPPKPSPLPPLQPKNEQDVEPVKQVMETNKSSAIPQEQMDDFVKGLVNLQVPLGFPLFTVSDNNSFHTTGYLWGLYALLALKKNNGVVGPVAVVNFDSHADAGKAKSEVVASDRWGSMLVSAIHSEGYPACYLSVFNHPKGQGVHFSAKGGKGALPEKPKLGELSDKETVLEKFTDFWSKVQAYFEDTPIKYVFFTIDRDVLVNSFTQWGDGAIDGNDELVALMKCALGPLNLLSDSVSDNPASLIGFDITGLPEIAGYIKTPTGGAKDAPVVWAAMEEELKTVKDFANGKLRLAGVKGSLTNVIFFSGSISYTGRMGQPDKENCWDFVSAISSGLNGILAFSDWSYLLCRKKAPIYHHGWKPFSLYRPAERLPKVKRHQAAGALGDPTPVGGFAATAGVSYPGRIKPDKVSLNDMIEKKGDFAPYHPDMDD